MCEIKLFELTLLFEDAGDFLSERLVFGFFIDEVFRSLRRFVYYLCNLLLLAATLIKTTHDVLSAGLHHLGQI